MAQKTKMTLVRQKFDADAIAIDRELEALLGGVALESVNDKPAGPPDNRIYWIEKKEKGNEFRWLKPSEWIETTHDGTEKRFPLKEVARTADYVELYDKSREVGVRLLRKASVKAANYKESKTYSFSGGSEGAWAVEPADVVYLTDLPEKVLKAENFRKYGVITDANGGELIYLSNRPSPNGLFTHPASKDAAVVSYEIGALHKNIFRAKIGIADSRRYNSATPLKFIVLGDGKKLYTSEPVQRWGVPQECEVSVRGVSELVLRVECDGPYDFAYAVWCEARLSAK